MGVHFAKALEPGNVDLGVGVVAAHLGGDCVPLIVGIGDLHALAPRQLVQGRHGGVDVAVLDQRPHIPEEEGQQQRADMSAVHIGIGHDDDLVIPKLFNVEFVPDARAQRHDQGI